MASINPALLARLQEKLGIGRAAVYRQIQAANAHVLEPNLAALSFATSKGIAINRYSSAVERADLRSAIAGHGRVLPQPPSIMSSGRREAKKTPARVAAKKTKKDNTIFVVHGRNESLRKSMFDFLRSIGLEPVEWEKAVLKAKGGNPYVEDVLRTTMENVHAIVVLLTPDDEAKLKDEFVQRGERSTEGKLLGQPRANVLFEAGWAVGRFPEKTLLVQVGKLRGFTDIGGKHMLHLGNDASKRTAFANRLKKFGCKIDLDGSDWSKTGDFRA